MTTKSIDHNRLLLEIDKTLRDLNREIINPEIPKLKLADLTPVMKMVARSRAKYLTKLFDIAKVTKNAIPSAEQISQLRDLRITYEELVQAAKALETAIQRCYLDIH